MKVVFYLFTLVIFSFGFYGLGYYSNRSHDYSNICSQKVHDSIMENSVLKENMKRLPFDVVYHYILGRTYACMNDI